MEEKVELKEKKDGISLIPTIEIPQKIINDNNGNGNSNSKADIPIINSQIPQIEEGDTHTEVDLHDNDLVDLRLSQIEHKLNKIGSFKLSETLLYDLGNIGSQIEKINQNKEIIEAKISFYTIHQHTLKFRKGSNKLCDEMYNVLLEVQNHISMSNQVVVNIKSSLSRLQDKIREGENN